MQPSRLAATAGQTGRACPYCRFPLKEGVEVVACGFCQSAHHGECWDDNGGCAIVACKGGPGAETPAAPPQTPPAAAPVAAPVQPGRRGRGPAIALAVLAALAVAAGAGAWAVSGQDDGDDEPASREPAPAAVAPEPEPPEPVAEPIARREVRDLLDRYAALYSAEDLPAFSRLLAPDLVRRRTEETEDRREAIAEYRRQFKVLEAPRYEFVDQQIVSSGDDADVFAHYEIASANTETTSGAIDFHVIRHEGELAIDRIEIDPTTE